MTGGARVVTADRSQLSWDLLDLEAMLPRDHRARIVWSFTGSLDLGPFYAAIGSREGVAGHPAADPRVLLALWLYATLEGVGSARALARLVKSDIAYRWLAGGVPVNYHGLSDFRVGWTEELDRLLRESVAALVSEGVLDLKEIAIDGTKVRSPVSSRSFTRGGRLARIEEAARRWIEALKAEVETDPGAGEERRRKAEARAAARVLEKAARAREALERLRREKEARARKNAKAEKAKDGPAVSLTDPQARRMRFADGATGAGYNVQTAADPVSGIIVAVATTDRRNDTGLAAPMVLAIMERYGVAPERLLMDQGYASRADIVAIDALTGGRTAIYMPPKRETPKEDLAPDRRATRRFRRSREPAAVKDWRERMQTAEARQIFRGRKLIERAHAFYKNRAMRRLTVRGLLGTQAVTLWHALANNVMTAHRLRGAA